MEKTIMSKGQQKLGKNLDGKDNIGMFIAETLGVEYKDGIIDFSENKEFIKSLDEINKNNKI